MFFKLAVGNIRKSVGDFAIYFVTVAIGVCMFYVFNAIDSQQIMFDINSVQSEYVDTTARVMSMFSGVVACILGFLIIYANRFLMRRRRREFGIYMTLGASPAQISRVVVYEALIVGAASLALGLAVGVALSQGLAFVTAALMGTTISSFRFVFSPQALVQTLISFAIIYVVVTAVNLVQARRFKIAQLLRAGSTPERRPVRHPALMAATFVASCAVLGLAYWQLQLSGMNFESAQFMHATALMLVGTLGFFYSLAGFVTAALTRIPRAYLRGLTPFTTGQITSRINTAFVSLWAICVMLFFAITVFCCGFSFVQIFCGNINEVAPYDATIRADWVYPAADYAEEFTQNGIDPGATIDASTEQDIIDEGAEGVTGDTNNAEGVTGESATTATQDPDERLAQINAQLDSLDQNAQDYRLNAMKLLTPARLEYINQYGGSMAAALEAQAQGWSSAVAQSAQVDIYQVASLTYADIFDAARAAGQKIGSNNSSDTATFSVEQIAESNVYVTSIDQVNQSIALCDGKQIDAASDTFAVLNNTAYTQDLASAIASTPLTIAGIELAAAGSVNQVQLLTSSISGTCLVLAVPAGVIDALKAQGAVPCYSYLNLQYATSDLDAGDAALNQALCTLDGVSLVYGEISAQTSVRAWPVSYVTQKSYMTVQAGGMRMFILAFVLLIATASILAIHLLTQAADSAPRYTMLARLGCSQRMLGRSLLVTTLVYFLAPLVLAAVHSAVAISVIKLQLFDVLGAGSVVTQCLIGAGILLAGYALYFGITYGMSKRIVLGKPGGAVR
jgi:putative ABC transport system permease protein